MKILYNIALGMIWGVGPMLAKSLLSVFGDSEQIFRASKRQLLRVPGIGEVTASLIKQSNALERASKELIFIQKNGIEVLFLTDDNYPTRLKECIDSPITLYYKGSLKTNQPKIISIVGTRNITTYGKEICRNLIQTLAAHPILIVSGLATGVDVAIHKLCLEYNIPTIGVMGHGLDRIYPKNHREISKKMVLNGGLLTEFPTGTAPDRENFPKRNRIIAGMADAVVVVEASRKGGALITAEIANSYNKDVYAYPGRCTDLYSEGCNFLIKTNRAALIGNGADLIYNLGWDSKAENYKGKQIILPLNFTNEERNLIEILSARPLQIDELQLKAGVKQSKLAVDLLKLEMQGAIVCLPGKVYKLA